MGTRFDQVWGTRDAELIVYAGGADETSRQGALSSLKNSFVAQFASLVHDSTDIAESEISNAAQSQLTDTIRVIDDQRSKSATVVAADDHTASAATNPVGDLIATSAVAKLPSKFS
jgi:predicted cation transporter